MSLFLRAVDKGVQHGCDDCVHHRGCCTWVCIVGNELKAILPSYNKIWDNGEVRHTGGKCFIFPLSRWDSAYRGNYFRIWTKDTKEGTTTQQDSCKIHHCVIKKCVRTGKLTIWLSSQKGGEFQCLCRRTVATPLSFVTKNSGHLWSKISAPVVHRAGSSWWLCSGEVDKWPQAVIGHHGQGRRMSNTAKRMRK